MAYTMNGADELRRIVRVCDASHESAFDGMMTEEVVQLVRACLASDWDVLPSDLTPDERKRAAERGGLDAETIARLRRDLR